MDYMGRHEVFERYLVEFSQGWVVKGTFEQRKRYSGHKVIDMSKIRMDFARNEVSDASFICLDRAFFTDNYKSGATSDEKVAAEEGVKAPEESKEPVEPPVDYSKLSGALQQQLVQGMRGQSPTKQPKRA